MKPWEMVPCAVETVYPLNWRLLRFLRCRYNVKLYRHWLTLWEPCTT